VDPGIGDMIRLLRLDDGRAPWDGARWQRSVVGPDEPGLVHLLEVLRGG
jgi:hypothetical protein